MNLLFKKLLNGHNTEYHNGYPSAAQQEVVVLTQILSDDINLGYTWDEVALECVTSVNGSPIRSMHDLVQNVERVKSSEQFLEITVSSGGAHGRGGLPIKIVMDVDKLEESTERLMLNYRIPSDRSYHFES